MAKIRIKKIPKLKDLSSHKNQRLDESKDVYIKRRMKERRERRSS